MAKINSLRDIIQFNSNFKTAINLYLSLNKAEKVLGYIPTKSSVSFLGEYLKAVLENKEQATLLVGPYGKGKSHLLLVLLAVLSMKKTPESESAINELIDNVSKTDEVGERVSEYIGQVWDKKRFLPVLITDTTGDLNQKANEDRIPKEHLAKYICQFYLSRTYSDLIHDDRQINVFSKYKLEKHHIVPVGSVSKIGESTDILRKDKTNIVNSPLNYVFISDATNLEISNISLKEYEQDITASAKAALNIVNYPSVEKLNDKTTIKAWLKERYKILKGQIQNRVMNMLLS